MLTAEVESEVCGIRSVYREVIRIKESLMVRQNVIVGVDRLFSARPVVHLRRKIGAATSVDVGRDVERLLWGELLRAIDRHERVNVGDRSVYSRHSCADVARATVPQRGCERGALAIRSVTPHARGGKSAGTTRWISRKRLKAGKALSLHLGTDRYSARKKCEIS